MRRTNEINARYTAGASFEGTQRVQRTDRVGNHCMIGLVQGSVLRTAILRTTMLRSAVLSGLLGIFGSGALWAQDGATERSTDTAPPAETSETALLERFYPAYAAWRNTGVDADIDQLVVPSDGVTTLAPGEDIAAALAGLHGPGVLQLAAGHYPLRAPLVLGSGQYVIGSGSETVISYDAITDSPPLSIHGADGACLAGVTIRYTDPDDLEHAGHLVPDTWAHAPGVTPAAYPVLSLTESHNVIIKDVLIHLSPGDAVQIEQCANISLVDLRIDTALNRGTDSGRLVISNSHHLEVTGLEVIGLRRIELNGPLSYSAFTDCVFGAGMSSAMRLAISRTTCLSAALVFYRRVIHGVLSRPGWRRLAMITRSSTLLDITTEPTQ